MTAVLSIALVTPASDIITSVGHGLLTGDGPIAIYTAAGTYPGGLAAATDYWAIRIDSDDVKLATSAANAAAGTTIDITTAGSGTLLLLVGLPYRVPRIAAAGSQVKSADLNDAWNAQVALWNLLTAQAQSVFSGIALADNQNIKIGGTGKYKRGALVRHLPGTAGVLVSTPVAGTSYYGGGGTITFKAAGNVFRFPLLLEEGEQLQTVHADVSCGSADTLVMKLYRSSQASGSGIASETQLGTTQSSAGHSSAVEQLAITGLTETVGNGMAWYTVEMTCSSFSTAPTVVG
ncbi:MAG: hypothetical protein ABI467_28855, partial [Kofleriaceae bacterium]